MHTTMHNIRVLIVEDDPTSMNYLEIILNKEGLEYKTAADGREGLQVVKEYKPHSVLSDLNMPHMSGIELLSAIKRIRPQTIVIMLTAFDSEEYVIESMRYGANNYLKKPILRENIIGLLRKYKAVLFARNEYQKIHNFIQTHSFSMSFDSDIRQVPFIINYLIEEIDSLFKEDEAMGIRLGLDEIIVNAIEHGNLEISYVEKSYAIQEHRFEELLKSRKNDPIRGKRKVSISFEYTKEYCEWIISDEGQGFDPDSIPNPITSNSSEMLHGRGIFITRFQFDELEYLGKGNVVRLRKRVKQSS